MLVLGKAQAVQFTCQPALLKSMRVPVNTREGYGSFYTFWGGVVKFFPGKSGIETIQPAFSLDGPDSYLRRQILGRDDSTNTGSATFRKRQTKGLGEGCDVAVQPYLPLRFAASAASFSSLLT